MSWARGDGRGGGRCRRDFGEVMLASLDAGRLAAAWALTIARVGRFECAGEPAAAPLPAGTVVDTPLYFEAGERSLRVTFSPDGTVAGLFICPASSSSQARNGRDDHAR